MKAPPIQRTLKHLLNVLHRNGFKHTLRSFQNSSLVPSLAPVRIKLHVSLTFLSCSHKKDLTDQFKLWWLAKYRGLEMKTAASVMLETKCKSYRVSAVMIYVVRGDHNSHAFNRRPKYAVITLFYLPVSIPFIKRICAISNS